MLHAARASAPRATAPPSPIQSRAKHNRKPTQLTENKHQRSKSIASFCHNLSAPPPHPTNHDSRGTHHASRFTTHQSRISNLQSSSIRNRANPLTTNEKLFSDRYFFGLFVARPARRVRESCELPHRAIHPELPQRGIEGPLLFGIELLRAESGEVCRKAHRQDCLCDS
jgi:hypothetical protein